MITCYIVERPAWKGEKSKWGVASVLKCAKQYHGKEIPRSWDQSHSLRKQNLARNKFQFDFYIGINMP